MPPLSIVVGRYNTSEVSKTADLKKQVLSDTMIDAMREIAQQRRRQRGWRGIVSNSLAKSEVAYYQVEELSAPYLMTAWLESSSPSTEASLLTQVVRISHKGTITEAMDPTRRANASRRMGNPIAWSEVLFVGEDYSGMEPESKLRLVEDVIETVNLVFGAEGMPEITFSNESSSEDSAS